MSAVELAGLVTSTLEGASLSQSPAVERVYLPVYDTATVTGLKVFVVPVAQSIDRETRSTDRFTHTIRLGIYKPVTSASVEQVDEMIGFTEEVIDLFRATRVLGSAYSFAGATNDLAYDPVQLDEHGVFVSVVSLQYVVVR